MSLTIDPRDPLTVWNASLPAWVIHRPEPSRAERAVMRQEIAEAAIRLVCDSGLEGLSLRRLASAMNCSTTTINHHFADRRELWIAVYRTTILRTQARIRRAYESSGGSPLACALAQMPIDRESREDWHIYLAQYHVACTDDELAREEREQVRIAARDFAELLHREHGMARDRARKASRQIITLLVGVATQALFEPRSWSPRRQKRFLEEQFALLGVPA
ncbi:TetR family transcriptional regulator C-terminal domain-containing protein [Novosphingobium resinovorum]|uniref:TetR/AcrR family transcriptional regulator n=1 Tax=Novosphingobium TaxID=165696 RepID=UPI001B3C50BD|nr:MULTISPECIES: TetR family transcriptional regulator C-terminal domain-containing protein [Novosphingobium]MBF7014725.1 TetR/AcrR family transcriptional regulator [Novosphingobium sp. HR1a]WJM24793.1 TetR family transcriptional regulator C-terminal domain-containing protein [Novosphingobium resinovorum]